MGADYAASDGVGSRTRRRGVTAGGGAHERSEVGGNPGRQDPEPPRLWKTWAA